MDSTKSSRFTVLNSDSDSIYISKNLMNKISQQNQQQKESSPATSSSPASTGTSKAPESQSDHHHHHHQHHQKLPPKSASPSPPGNYFERSTGHLEPQMVPQQQQAQPATPFSFDNSMPASLDPEYVAKHIDFDAGTNLYGLHGKYERKLQQYQQSWRAKWEELNVLNDKLFKLNSDKFAKEVKRVDERYFRDHKTYERPCNDAERKVLDCYVRNGKKPLLCIDEVQQFSACVNKARVDLLKR